jgi:hypothetical protein
MNEMIKSEMHKSVQGMEQKVRNAVRLIQGCDLDDFGDEIDGLMVDRTRTLKQFHCYRGRGKEK